MDSFFFLHFPPYKDKDSLMNILVVGSGGREHAIALAVKKSPLCDTLVCAPGNPGMAGNDYGYVCFTNKA